MCDICGAEMSPYEIEDHQRHAHPDILEKRQQEFSRALRRGALIFAPSGVAFFLALFVPRVIFGISEPGWYVGVIFLAFMISVFTPILYQAKKQGGFGPAVDILAPCPVCDRKVPYSKAWAHMDSEHRPEAVRLKVVRSLVYGSLLGIYLLFMVILCFAIVGIFPLDWGLRARTLVIVLLAVWSALFIPWVFLVERPHRARIRAEWKATHFVSQNRSR
jgi:hypothetical protein